MMKGHETPSKLSFKHYDKKISITLDHSDIDMEEFYESCKHLALAIGFGHKAVNAYFEEQV